MEAGARRLPPPPVVRRYDIARSARQLLDVYDLALSAAPGAAGTGRGRAAAGPVPGATGGAAVVGARREPVGPGPAEPTGTG